MLLIICFEIRVLKTQRCTWLKSFSCQPTTSSSSLSPGERGKEGKEASWHIYSKWYNIWAQASKRQTWTSENCKTVTISPSSCRRKIMYLSGLVRWGFPVQWLLSPAGTGLAAGGAEKELPWRSPSLYAPYSGETNGYRVKAAYPGNGKTSDSPVMLAHWRLIAKLMMTLPPLNR